MGDDSDMMVKIQPDVKIKVEKSEVPIHDNENEVPSYENDVPTYENSGPNDHDHYQENPIEVVANHEEQIQNVKNEYARASGVDLEKFVSDAKLLDPDLLLATLGPILNSRQSLWDVLVHKMNALESNQINKVVDCIQMVLNELRNLMVEIQGLMSSCCKDSNRMGAFFKCADQMSRCLTSDYFDKHTLEAKDVYEIPAYYLSMMLMSETPVKTEEEYIEAQAHFDEPSIEDDDSSYPRPEKKKRKYLK